MRKIKKTEAKQLYEQGIAVYVAPCKIEQDDENFFCFVNYLEKDYKFNDIVSYYQRMDCDEQNGKQLDFYCDKSEVKP